MARRGRFTVVLGTALALVVSGSVAPGVAAAGSAATEEQYVLLAERSVVLDRGVRVEGGVVAVREDAGSADAVRMDRDVTVTGAGSAVMGSRVSAGRDSILDRVVSNGGDLSAATVGEHVFGLTLPLDVAVPQPPAAVVGGQNVMVARGVTHALPPGAYGKLDVARDARVEFGEGTYTFTEVAADRNVALVFTGPADVVVAGSVVVGRDSTLGPVDGLDAGDVRWWAGAATEGGVSPTVAFDRNVTMTATLRSPDATVTFDRDARVTGTLVAGAIAIGRDSVVRYASPPPSPQEPRDPLAVTFLTPSPGQELAGEIEVALHISGGLAPYTAIVTSDDRHLATIAQEPYSFVLGVDGLAPGDGELVVTVTDADGDHAEGRVPITVIPPTDDITRLDPGLRAINLLEDDYEEGRVTGSEYARYALDRWFAPDRVPEQYRLPEELLSPPGNDEAAELTLAMMVALRDFDRLPPATQEELRGYFGPVDPLFTEEPLSEELVALAREAVFGSVEPVEFTETGRGMASTAPRSSSPVSFGVMNCDQVDTVWVEIDGTLVPTSCVYETPWASFYIGDKRWDLDGGIDMVVDEVDTQLRDTATGGGPNGVPDELDAIVSSYLQAFIVYDGLGYDRPSRLSVHIGSWHRGFAAPKLGWILMSPSGATNVIRHELFHHFQYRYAHLSTLIDDFAGRGNSTVGWWLEATAEWATHKATEALAGPALQRDEFTDFRFDYALHLPTYIDAIASGQSFTVFDPPAALLDWTPESAQYGAFIFVEYLEQEYDEDIVLDVWEGLRSGGATTRAIDVIDEVLRERTLYDSLRTVLVDFHLANIDIARNYESADSGNWHGRIGSGLPPHRTVDLRSTFLQVEEDAIGSGGVVYVRVPGESLGTNAAKLTAERIHGSREFRMVHAVGPLLGAGACGRRLLTRVIDPQGGTATAMVSLHDRCTEDVIVIVDIEPDVPLNRFLWNSDGSVRWSATDVRPDETIVEYRIQGQMHHRVESGDDIGRQLTLQDGWASFSVMFDQDPASRDRYELCLYSADWYPRATDTLIANGSTLSVDHRRMMATNGGRSVISAAAAWYETPALSCFLIPEEDIRHGSNEFRLQVRGWLTVYAAFLSSSHKWAPDPGWEPDPDPDPDPCVQGCAT